MTDSMSEKYRDIRYAEEDIRLFVDMIIGIGGDKWPAAELFCELISHETWKPYFSKLFNGKKVIELGAGTGLNSILIDRMFSPKQVLATDHSSHVGLIQKNIDANQCKCTTAASLDWCNLNSDTGKCDIALAFEW